MQELFLYMLQFFRFLLEMKVEQFVNCAYFRARSMLMSVRGRKNAGIRLLADTLNDYANGETSLFYWAKEKATTLLRRARVTMPKTSILIHSGYIFSIRDESSPVKVRYLAILS